MSQTAVQYSHYKMPITPISVIYYGNADSRGVTQQLRPDMGYSDNIMNILTLNVTLSLHVSRVVHNSASLLVNAAYIV